MLKQGSQRTVSFSAPSEGLGETFYEKVYEVVRMIPPGKVTSYGAIATFLGSAQSSRMVGWAMNNAHVQEKYVPAHRVVNRNGLLTGKHHFGTPTAMQEFLEAEGIQVIDDQIIDFEKHFWNPSAELAMD
ncbi:MAG TPA: MGMT family protein [Prolixibacteraceae bacterium]|nr:MGMT family protein [Prolixibacteraceae bacterium]